MISRSMVLCLGTAQLVSWGTSYYLIGLFGDHIAAETGWTRGFTYGGFSVGLLAMAFASPLVGRVVDRHGGLPVLAVGSLLHAAACVALAACQHAVVYYLVWIAIGLSMRLTLYDAAFAVLARIGGTGARRAMAQITLLGGLASTMFWPLGNALIEALGWRGALIAYAAFSLAIIPLYLSLPSPEKGAGGKADAAVSTAIATTDYRRSPAWLYATIMALVAFLSSGMSAHMIGIIQGLGLGATTAVWIASLRGIGQVAARTGDVLFGTRLSPLTLNLIAASLLLTSFILVPLTGIGAMQATLFALAFGAGNGLMSITRGTVPLVFMDPRTYGQATGLLLAPSFVLSAAGPIVLGVVIEAYGAEAAVFMSLATALLVFGLSFALRRSIPQASGAR